MFYDPLFWVAIAFVIFVVLMAKRVKDFVVPQLEKRAQSIHDDLTYAQKARENAQLAMFDCIERKEKALKSAEQILKRTEEDKEQLYRTAHEELETLLRHRDEQAAAHITQTHTFAIAEIKEQIMLRAIMASRHILARRLSDTTMQDQDQEETQDTLIDQTISELPTYLS